MSKMISVASGFQYSVNIGYDLNNDVKLKNFIPTKSALSLLEDILLSTHISSTDRARVLVGAYGKGKSHIVLMILSMLMKKDIKLFEGLMPKIKENPVLYQAIQNYYDSDEKILPVVINGSNTSLTQAFLLALQRTLAENELLDVMPDTNYKAAIAVIERWQEEYPDTYIALQKELEIPVSKLIAELEDFSVEAYETFEKVYPKLTAGSIFNPFLGFDVVELYEGVLDELQKKGYSGIYVVYDEFSKFLEANITEASVSDTKMLQDFAEKCNRSGKKQLHLMLISHKEIANYIDTLPKQKVDGWRGVSERFKHIHLSNNFTQTYEIIASVIQKKENEWNEFKTLFLNDFDSLLYRYGNHLAFSDMKKSDIEEMIMNCYPLHPVSTFVLPRLSEKVAQNERTLFTFLSANGDSTLPAFLMGYEDDRFDVITPDIIYDYFEPLFRKEVYTSETYKNYQLTSAILNKVDEESLEAKIIKTISLIYTLEQFEKLKPTKDEIVGIFSIGFTVQEIEAAITNLIEKEYVVYLKRSNDYLKLKQSSGEDLGLQIANTVAKIRNKTSIKDVLNASNFDSYIYPSRYNDDKEMTRYFSFEFISEKEVSKDTNWAIKSEGINADGVIYAVIPEAEESLDKLYEEILLSSRTSSNCVFILPKKYMNISDTVIEYSAVSLLRSKASSDKVLFDEYEVIYDDLKEVLSEFVNIYTRPELFKANYIYMGERKEVIRKATFTNLLSNICESLYHLTPIINNEAINRNEITSIAENSRNKIVSGLLRNELETNLGLSGSGQEVSIMRSTLVRTGILTDECGMPKLQLSPADPLMKNVLDTIISFIVDVRNNGDKSFDELYKLLTDAEYHIGLRKGVIPIYLAAVFHEFKQHLVISDRYSQVQINADTLMQINANPGMFKLSYLDWDPAKEIYIETLANLFADYVNSAEKNINSYDYIVAVMRRWYLSLPKYAKELRTSVIGANVSREYMTFIRLLRQNVGGHELLFNKLPEIFKESGDALCAKITEAKLFYDTRIQELKEFLKDEVKKVFAVNVEILEQASLTSIVQDWCETLDNNVFEQLFDDGTEKVLGLFKTITNDEDTFIARLAKAVTDLRIEDWNDSLVEKFLNKLPNYKKTAEEFKAIKSVNEDSVIEAYQVMFVDDMGKTITKRFDKVEQTKRGQLLHNAITADLDSMGHAISEQEKRQILMEILKKLC